MLPDTSNYWIQKNLYKSNCHLYLGKGMETCSGKGIRNLNSLYLGKKGLLKTQPCLKAALIIIFYYSALDAYV